MKIETLVRTNILNTQPYSSARDEFNGSGNIFLDANENPFPALTNRYPDPFQNELKLRISNVKGGNAQQLFLGNGSDEVLDLLVRAFCEPGKDSMLSMAPSYGMYKVLAETNGVELIEVRLMDNFQLDMGDIKKILEKHSPKLIFLCSPNNPSGNLLKVDDIEWLLRNFEGLVCIDEAYIDFADQESWMFRLDDFPNLVVCQTFSKAWGMAGVRIGMGWASKELVDILNKIKPPYNINQLSQDFALQQLTENKKVWDEIQLIKRDRDWLFKELDRLTYVKKVYPSDSNFLLVRMENAREVYNFLLDHGIVVRDRSGLTGCSECLRISIGTPDQNKYLMQKLNEYQG